MKASVIISTYNNFEDLRLLMPSLKGQQLDGHEMEVIIRDDGSFDNTCEWLKEKHPWATLLVGKNSGFSKSNNIAARHATGDAFVFVNADTLLDSRFVSAGLDVLEAEPGTAGVNCNMIMPWIMDKKEFIIGVRPECGYGYFLTRYGFAAYGKRQRRRYDCFFLSGGGCFVTRKALAGELPFSEDLWGATAYCEDLDLSLRLLAKGYRLRFEPNAILYHNQRTVSGLGLLEVKKFFRVSINRISVYAANMSFVSFLKFLPFFLLGFPLKVASMNMPQKFLKSAVVASAAFLPLFFAVIPYWIYLNLSSRHTRFQIKHFKEILP